MNWAKVKKNLSIFRLIKSIKKKINKRLKASKKDRQKLKEIESLYPEITSMAESLKLMQKGASICRFGDAEFDICTFRNENDRYQKPSEKLSIRLKEILAVKSTDNLLIGIPPFNAEHNNIARFYRDLSFWEYYWLTRWDIISPMFTQKSYANSFVSRDAVFYEVDVAEYRKIWEGKKLVFVVSKEGRFESDSRLFDNIKEAKYVYVPATSAFDEYDRVLAESKKFDKDYIFFIAAGPTATVLAYDLHQLGYQALDMGHLPNCYQQYLGESKAPEAIPLIRKDKLEKS